MGGVLVFCALCNPLSAKPSSSRPYAYLYPAKLQALTEYLQRIDAQVSELREDIELEVEIHHIKQIVDRERPDSKKQRFNLKTETRKETRRFEAGATLVKTGQDLGDRIEIVEGVAAGDRVAVSRTGKLVEGSRVRVESGDPK